ncbi:MAG: hypothetical protein ACRD6N_14100 [Pyrinomonadaceae bacterium]
MKGGITSGVVYPRAICALAGTYRLRNIGGTSAGAIAAAAAAAAEYCRANRSGDGYTKLFDLPDELAQKGLQRLFIPQSKTMSLYKLVLAFIGSSPWYIKLSKALLKLFAYFPIGAVVGALPGLLILISLNATGPIPFWLWVFLSLFLIALPSFLMALLNVVVQAIWAIPANNYGLCGGLAGKPGSQALTEWISDKIELLANKDKNENPGPLTFQDLWSAGQGEPVTANGRGERQINLEMMTTNLTFGRPYRLPFTEDEPHLFFFKSSEFGNLFPADVVEHMKNKPPRGRRDEKHWDKIKKTDYWPFPNPGDLPVVVATRMSLSFPLLLSAIPLYTVDWWSKETQATMARGETPVPERCLFSDGGISSNFPIHFFDSPIPRWPTFAINLSPFPLGSKRDDHDESKNVRLSECNKPNQFENWDRFDMKSWRLGGFLGAILNTMENWADQTQARVPGYRDRIATIYLEPDEGGLNLNMPTDIIQRLSARGEFAGKKLRERFDPAKGDGSGLNWENQRWIRYRSFMTVLENTLGRFSLAYEYEAPGVPSYAEMVHEGRVKSKGNSPDRCDELDNSPFVDSQIKVAESKTKALMDLALLWHKPEVAGTFEIGAPSPPAELRIRPKV